MTQHRPSLHARKKTGKVCNLRPTFQSEILWLSLRGPFSGRVTPAGSL